MNHPLVLLLFTLLCWGFGYGYYRVVKGWYEANTNQLTVALFPLQKTWTFAEGGPVQMLLAGFKWFSVVIGVVIGGPITLFFMIILPIAFVQRTLEVLGW